MSVLDFSYRGPAVAIMTPQFVKAGGRYYEVKDFSRSFKPRKRTVLVREAPFGGGTVVKDTLLIDFPQMYFNIRVVSSNAYADVNIINVRDKWAFFSLQILFEKEGKLHRARIPNTVSGNLCLGGFVGLSDSPEETADMTIDYFWKSEFGYSAASGRDFIQYES